MTNQEIFDKVVSGIFNQGGPSFTIKNAYIECLYRNKENGRKCAVGWILPDEEYTDILEGLPCDEIIWSRGLEMYLIQELQRAHDDSIVLEIDENPIAYNDAKFFENWIPKMIKIAEIYNLDKTKLNTEMDKNGI